MHRVVDAAAAALAPGDWPAGKPVTIEASAFFNLPEEVALRLLGRAVDRAGNEGPVELGKLEALLGNLDRHRAPGRFRRTLAGAVVTLSGGTLTVERAPPRHRAPKRP
jgi:tRNA(Ile)-lysidine synthase